MGAPSRRTGQGPPSLGARAPALLAALAACALALALPREPGAAEREYPTILALGWAQPIDTSEGLPTPIVVIDHESGGWYGDGRLAASLRTSELHLGITHRAAERLDLGYGLRGRVTTEGDGRDLYRDGNRESGSAFLGDSLAAIASAGLFPESPWRPGLELERMETRFRPDPATRDGYRLPENFAQNEVRLFLARAGLLGEEEAEIRLTLAAGERFGWRDWSLDGDSGRTARYSKLMLHGGQPLGWEGGDRSAIEAWLLAGDDLDLFSGYAVGGLTGHYPVGGYFRNEFRTQQGGVLNLSHELRFAEDRRLSFHAEGARLWEIALAPQDDRGAWRTLASLGLGLYYGIRPLGGLPVILRVAEGVLIPEASKEGHRREVLLVLAAGF